MTTLVSALLVVLALTSTVGVGLELDVASLRDAGQRGALWRSLLANLVFVPCMLWLLCLGLSLPAESTVALVLIAVLPGGASAPLLARLAGGDATRTAVLYTGLCLAALVSALLVVPHFLSGTSGYAGPLMLVALLQLAPMLAGALVRRSSPTLAARGAAHLRRLGTVLLLVIVVLLLATRTQFLATMDPNTVLAMLLLAGASLGAGWLAATVPRLPDAMLAAIRNLTLALVLAELSSPGGRTSMTIAAYGLVMYTSAMIVLGLSRKTTEERRIAS